MSYNTKNYTEQDGDVTHFGGKVVFEEGSQIEGLPVQDIPDAGPETKGLVKQGVAVANCTGSAPTAQDFNSLLISLRAAGIIAVEA